MSYAEFTATEKEAAKMLKLLKPHMFQGLVFKFAILGLAPVINAAGMIDGIQKLWKVREYPGSSAIEGTRPTKGQKQPAQLWNRRTSDGTR